MEPPQIVSPHPCSLKPSEFMMPTLKELHKHAAWPFSPEGLAPRLAVAGSSCTAQPGPELVSSVGLSVPPTRGHSVTPELTCVKSYVGNYHKYVFIYYLCHIPNRQKHSFYVLHLCKAYRK